MPEKIDRRVALWSLAFVAESIAATLEMIAGDYVKASALYALAAAFLLIGFGSGTSHDRWITPVAYLLVALSMGLLVYRFAMAG